MFQKMFFEKHQKELVILKCFLHPALDHEASWNLGMPRPESQLNLTQPVKNIPLNNMFWYFFIADKKD